MLGPPRLPPMRTLQVVLVALLLAAPAVLAGTQADPEIADGAGDTEHPDAGRDIAAFWIDDQLVDIPDVGPGLAFNLLMAGAYSHTPAMFAFHEDIRVGFKLSKPGVLSGDEEAYISFRPSMATTTGTPGDQTLACRFGIGPSEGAFDSLSEEQAITGEFAKPLYRCFVPTLLLGDFYMGTDQIVNLHIDYRQIVRGPLSGAPPAGGDNIPPTTVRTYDVAPDSGYGRPFPSGPVEPEPEPVPEEPGVPEEEENETGEPEAPPSSQPGPTGPEPADANETTPLAGEPSSDPSASGDEKKSPGPGWVALGGLFVAAARRLRRNPV